MKGKKIDNYWSEAVEFTNTLIVPDFDEKFVAYCKKKKLKEEKVQFLKYLIKDAINLRLTVADLKHLRK